MNVIITVEAETSENLYDGKESKTVVVRPDRERNNQIVLEWDGYTDLLSINVDDLLKAFKLMKVNGDINE